MITPEIQAEILTRAVSEGQSVRQIALDLGLNRRSVARVITRRTIQAGRKRAERSSILDPFKDEIKNIIKEKPACTASALLNRLRPLGFVGSISILRTYVRTLKSSHVRPRQAFLRLEFAPAEVAQVDWGEFGDVFGDGVKIHCFAMVLCHSRYLYIEFTRTEKFEDFIRCHENAFRSFGGVPKQCWYDNLTTAVTDRAGNIIRFNARFMAYMGHHAIRPHACNVARGNEKGRVEDLIKYIRLNFWPAREFKDFEDLEAQARVWQTEIANRREHRATRRIVRLMFESDEKSALMPMNPHTYDTDETMSRIVPPDFHVVYDTNRYSLPWTLVGLAVTLKINATHIKIFYNERSVTTHVRSYQKNKVFTLDAHKQGLLAKKPGSQRVDWQIAAVKNIGPKMHEYIELLRSGERSLKRELSRLLALATVYGDRLVHEAAWHLIEKGVIGVEALEVTLKKLHHPAENSLNPAPISFSDQKLNRTVPAVDLRRYDALLFEHDPPRASAPGENTSDFSES